MRFLIAAALFATYLPIHAEERPELTEQVEVHPHAAAAAPAAPKVQETAATTAWDQTEPAEMRRSRQMRRADLRFQISAGMTYGGLALLVASPFLIQADPEFSADLMALAFAAYMVGEPVMGGAATSLDRLASGLPGYQDPGSGWRPYAWSHVLKGAGAVWFLYVFLSNVEMAGFPPFFFPYADISMAELYPVFGLLGAGFATEGYALYQFHSRRNRAMESLGSRVSWAPTLKRRADGRVDPGLAVSMAF